MSEQREFFRLAAWWLGCQWQMVHAAALPCLQAGGYDPGGVMTGWRDARLEMGLLVRESQNRQSRRRVHA